MKYQYLIVATNGEKTDTLQTALNEHGAEGWKITTSIGSKTGTWIIMEKTSEAWRTGES
jgi:hypothetical protein